MPDEVGQDQPRKDASPNDLPTEAAAAQPASKAERPWYKKKRWIFTIGVILLIVVVAAAGGGESNNADKSSSTAKSTATPAPTKDVANEETPTATAEKTPALTSGQENALRSAENYLDLTGMSKQGLIEQLSSSAGEGYSKADATYAANHVKADWNKEAVESAKSYLEMSPMSKAALIDQLSSSAGEQFTPAQARYAASKAY